MGRFFLDAGKESPPQPKAGGGVRISGGMMLSAVVAVTAVTAASDTAGGLSRLFQLDHIPDDGGNDGRGRDDS